MAKRLPVEDCLSQVRFNKSLRRNCEGLEGSVFLPCVISQMWSKKKQINGTGKI